MEKGDLYGERKREENKESRNQASDQRKPVASRASSNLKPASYIGHL